MEAGNGRHDACHQVRIPVLKESVGMHVVGVHRCIHHGERGEIVIIGKRERPKVISMGPIGISAVEGLWFSTMESLGGLLDKRSLEEAVLGGQNREINTSRKATH